MNWETFAIAGFQALSARQDLREGKAAARAIVEEGQIAAENKANDTVRAAGKLQNNFLNSGLTLEAGPSDIIRRAFSAGQKDIDRIVTNANTRSKNTMSQARTKALEGIASTVKGIDFGGGSLGGLFSANSGTGMPDYSYAPDYESTQFALDEWSSF